MLENSMKTENWKLKIIIAVFTCVLLLRVFVFEAFFVNGDSMYPTLQAGDYVLVNKTAYWFNDPGRGDVVVARARSGERLIKRVMGLPTEWFEIDDKPANVDPREYYLIGDNRELSVDSRTLGAVYDWDVDGRVMGALRFKSLEYVDF